MKKAFDANLIWFQQNAYFEISKVMALGCKVLEIWESESVAITYMLWQKINV